MRGLACIVILFAACSHSAAPVSGLAENDIDLYIRAKTLAATKPAEACPVFLKLSQSSSFALKDVAFVRSLYFCTPEVAPGDNMRIIPDWLKKEERLAQFKRLATFKEKALLIIDSPQFFPSRDRVSTYQKALEEKDLSDDQRKKIETALYSIAPRFNPKTDPKDLFRVTKDLRSVRDFDKARKLLNAVITDKKQSTESKMAALKEIYLTYKIQRHLKAEYLNSARNWANHIKPKTADFKKHIGLFTESQINLVRTLWTEVSSEEPLKILETLEKQLNGVYSRHELFWLRARMLEEKNDIPGAIANLEKSVKESGIPLKDHERALWSLAWLELKQKNFAAAKTQLNTLISMKDISPFARLKYTFWLAETEQRDQHAEDANKLFDQLTQEDTFGYYGLLAHQRLNKNLSPLATTPAEVAITLLTEVDRKIFNSLIKANDFDLASQFLSATLISKHRPQDLSLDEGAQLLQLIAKAKNYKLVFEIFNQLPFDKQKKVLALHPEILFPRPFAEAIAQAEQKTSTEAELIYSIMRQESSFDPQARSPMDAVGLLQLLPEVAQKVAKRINAPYNGFEDLNNEATNILLGADLLKKQQERFENHFILYVASYNASDSAVRQWRERNKGDSIEFIENIPYEETKAYVKLVMRNYIIYKKLRFGEDFKSFPQYLLEL